MPIVLSEWATSQEISNRIDRLRMQYAGNPLVKRIDHDIGVDWSDDPAVFIDVILPGNEIAAAELERLAEDIRVDLLRLVRTDEIGLHSYLNFVKLNGRVIAELPEQFMSQAEFLLREAAFNEANVRRAVSSAYYALFLLLIRDAVVNWKHADQHARLARSFDHKRMKDASTAIL